MKRFGKQLLSVVKAVAPGIAAVAGGPFGGLAAAALQAAFGTDDQAEIEKQLAIADPATLAKLRAAERNFQLKRQELGITEDQLYVKDTQDARGMARVLGSWPQIVLTSVAIIIYGMLLQILFEGSPDGEATLTPWQQGQVGILIGVLTTMLMQAWNFWFGTSKGSKEKADQLAAMSDAR